MLGQKVFNAIIKGSKLGVPVRKGRNNSLVSKRNECLIARYYYYGYYKNKCYEEIMRLLVNEFFLAPVTINIIIQNNSEQLQSIKLRAKVMHYFQNHWPHLKW